MEILSEVLDALSLRCTGVDAVTISDAVTGSSGPVQACVVVSGVCRIRFRDDGESCELRPLDGLFLTGSEEYELEPVRPSSPARLLRCDYSLERRLPHPFAQNLPRRMPLRSVDLTDETEFGRAVWLLEGERINSRPGFDYVVLRFAEIMLVEMLRRCQLVEQPPTFFVALSDTAIHAALQRIHARIDHPWHVRELASDVGLSKTVFAERFHHLVGEPPLRYVRLWRMLKAHRQILESTVPIKTIAKQTGYDSAAGFRRAFRRVFGRSPSSLR